MHYAFKYVIANEGVDTEKKYPFYSKVSIFHPADDVLDSNTAVCMMRIMLGARCLAQ